MLEGIFKTTNLIRNKYLLKLNGGGRKRNKHKNKLYLRFWWGSEPYFFEKSSMLWILFSNPRVKIKIFLFQNIIVKIIKYYHILADTRYNDKILAKIFLWKWKNKFI